jgi:CheY-like chemotaxis protein
VSTILLADDNPHAQRMGSEILGQEGHTVVTVPDGDAALSYLAVNRPALVLADITMPGVPGYEICRFIKGQPELEHIKVVLLRGPLEPLDQARLDQARPDGLLQKPLDADKLVSTVASLLAGIVEEPRAPRPKSVPRTDSAAGGAPSVARDPLQGLPSRKASGAAHPFVALVERALQTDRDEAEFRIRVRAAVSEAVEEMTPALIDRITERVLDALREN